MHVYRKNDSANKISTIFFAMLLLFVSFLLIKGTFSIYNKAKNSSYVRDIAKEKLESLEERKNFLENEARTLETERGIEEGLRQKFNVAKAGEVSVVIVRDVDKDIKAEETGFFGNFWNKLSNIFNF